MSESQPSKKKETKKVEVTHEDEKSESQKSEKIDEENSPSNPSDATPQVVPFRSRTRLPIPMVDYNFSIWSVLKIGKDMSHLSLPVQLFEPVGFLQVLCEELEYSNLLEKASNQTDIYMRMVYVACFAISRYASMAHRGQRKPFNPLEGETFENNRDDLGWWFFAEQISHRPRVSACIARSKTWEFWQTMFYHVAFWGKSIEAEQKTPVNLTLLMYQETYSWNKVISSLHNLFRGTKYFDHHGKMTVTCSNGVSCKVAFKKMSCSTKHEIQGSVFDSSNHVKYTIFGKWSEAVYLGVPSKCTCIWKSNKLPPEASKYYGFTNFTMSLNELTRELQETLPPTDSRLRPDQRYLEEGKIKEAQTAKYDVEEIQRNRRKQRKVFKPLWFTEKKKNDWKFSEQYLQAKETRFENVQFEKLW